MTHPLTDKKLKELFWDHAVNTGWDKYDWTSDGMRSAADWQLEQVFEQWEEVIDSNKTDIQVIREFDKRLKAMRPQVVDLPQANSDVCGEEGMKRALQRTLEENDELMRKLSDS